jgi:hypothetical protein
MPVTKIIERVTLGDLASDPSCTTPAKVQLLIRQHAPPEGRDDAGGDLGTFTQASISAAAQELPGSRAQVSWTVPATKLLKGRDTASRSNRDAWTDPSTWDDATLEC